MLTTKQRQQFQKAEADLDNLTVERLRDLFLLLDFSRQQEFRDGVFDTMPGLIEELSDVSALLAASEYELTREQAGAAGRFVVDLAAPAPAEQIGKATSFALAPMFWPNYIERGRVELQEVIEQRVEAMAPRLVRQGGRDTLVENTERDPARPRYRRVLSSSSGKKHCDFCVMLAGRSAVYRSEDSAGAGQHWHDHCYCRVELSFT